MTTNQKMGAGAILAVIAVLFVFLITQEDDPGIGAPLPPSGVGGPPLPVGVGGGASPPISAGGGPSPPVTPEDDSSPQNNNDARQ